MKLLTAVTILIIVTFITTQVSSCNRKKEIQTIRKDITNINEVLANHKYFVEQLIIMGISNKLFNIDTKSVTNK